MKINWTLIIKIAIIILILCGIGIPLAKWFLDLPTSFYDLQDMIDANLITDQRWLLVIKGFGTTIFITFCSILLGTVLGGVFCLMRISNDKFLRSIGTIYVTIIRGTPTVIQLMLIYYGIFGSVDISKVLVAIIAFGINSGAYICEIMRGGILAVNKGQIEAGRSLGFSQGKTMAFIILPQAFKNMLPTYTSEVIVLLKETAICGFIALNDLTKVVDFIRSRTWEAFFPYIIAALLYLAMTTLIAKCFNSIEERMRKSDNR